MSKRGSKVPDLGRTPSKRPSIVSVNHAKPSTSNADPKELYSYTPNWITPEEKAKLKARVQQIKIKEQRLTLKEDVVLLHASKKSSRDSSRDTSPETGKGKGKDKGKAMKKSSTSSDGSKDDEKLQKTKSDKSVKSQKSKSNLSEKDSKESTKKEKSKESMKDEKSKESVKKEKSKDSMKKEKSKDSVKSTKSEKGKNKEDLRMRKKPEEGHGKHPKEAHANPSGNTMEKKPQREISKSELDEHLWATDYAHFDPQLYHFKSPEKLSTKNPVMAECPPFWVLLDHTIAVTWKLFCQDAERNDLGIIPLQWSREFVSAMRDERGEYLSATGQLLSAVEDALIDRYAKAADADETEKPQTDDHERSNKKDCGKKGKGDCKKDQDSLSYVSSESIFKHPVEVSYTLKDIMSRNMPGRKHAEGEEGGVQNRSDAVVNKVDVPPPEDHESMSRSDMLGYLKQLKEEQDLRVQKEKEHGEKIEALMELLAKGKVDGDLWFEGHDSKKKHEGDHVHFDQDEEDGLGAKSQKGDKRKADGKGKGGKEKGGKEKGGKEKGHAPVKEENEEKPVREEKKAKSSEEDDHRKKKVSMEDDKKVKKDKGAKRKKSDASLSSKSSNGSSDYYSY